MKVLFVCLGNICRSPAAEGIFRKMSEKSKLKFEVDSAGTGSWHVGEPPDGRMIAHAKQRGYDLTRHEGRQFDADKDFEDFDLIVTMDDSNFRNVSAFDRTGKYKNKIRKAASFCNVRRRRNQHPVHEINEVPDPYYRGDDGFHHVLDILEDSCAEILNQIETGKYK
jgi:protein-tyrosine phosphatase